MPQTTKQFFGITEEQVKTIGNYLVSRPYGEVEKYITILRQLPTINVVVESPVAAPPQLTDSAQLPIGFPPAGPHEDAPDETLKPQV